MGCRQSMYPCCEGTLNIMVSLNCLFDVVNYNDV
jgi:hypothetical protein